MAQTTNTTDPRSHSKPSSPALPRLHRLHDIHVSPDVVALLEGDIAPGRNLVRHAARLHARALEGAWYLEGLLALGGLGSCLAVGGGVGRRRLTSVTKLDITITSRQGVCGGTYAGS